MYGGIVVVGINLGYLVSNYWLGLESSFNLNPFIEFYCS